MSRKLAIFVVTLAVAAVGGGAYAATQSSSSRPRQALLNDVAKRLNVSPAKLRAAFQAAMIDRINAAVKAGRLTQAQGNALKRRIQQGVPFGFMHPGRPRFMVPPGPGGGPLGTAAHYLGLTPTQLFNQLRSGKSLAQVAAAQHKSAAGLEKAMVAAIKVRLDEAVKHRLLTAAQEQRILRRLESRIHEKINNRGFGPRFGGDRVGPRFGGDRVGPGAGGPPGALPGPGLFGAASGQSPYAGAPAGPVD
jgi:AraC-like DNA-binding protein